MKKVLEHSKDLLELPFLWLQSLFIYF
uniref:Uncharacterized protein n=1 Tax=Anguilla anguilla TaxID=7936 RepID=A0A0E9SA91_ANGAN